MSTTTVTHTDTTTARHAAALALHRAEIALHDAHQTGIDTWIDAANDRLHLAAVAYAVAVAQDERACAQR